MSVLGVLVGISWCQCLEDLNTSVGNEVIEETVGQYGLPGQLDCLPGPRRMEAKLIIALTIQNYFPPTTVRKYGEVVPHNLVRFDSILMGHITRGPPCATNMCRPNQPYTFTI